MKRESFNSGWLFCHGSGTAPERMAICAQTVIPAVLTRGDGDLKIEVQ